MSGTIKLPRNNRSWKTSRYGSVMAERGGEKEEKKGMINDAAKDRILQDSFDTMFKVGGRKEFHRSG